MDDGWSTDGRRMDDGWTTDGRRMVVDELATNDERRTTNDERRTTKVTSTVSSERSAAIRKDTFWCFGAQAPNRIFVVVRHSSFAAVV